MSYTLFPHQEKGAAFLAAQPGTRGLFFGMGTGKTITSLEAVRQVWQRKTACRVLVIAPPIALPMWQEEAENYIGVGAKILKASKTKIDLSTVLVVSYDIARRRADELRDWLRGDGILICDESHALKSAAAKRTKAILGSGGIASGAEYVWMLTGTPITRWNDDLFPFLCRADMATVKEKTGITKFDNPTKALERFQRAFCIRQQKQFPGARFPTWQVVGNQRTEELGDWVYGEGLALRVDLKEVFDSMPPLTTNRYKIDLDTKAIDIAQIKEFEKANTLAEMQQKRNDPALATIRRMIGLGKVKAAAAEIIERIESGQHVLVGAWHTEVIDELKNALDVKGYVTDVIDGRAGAHAKKSAQDDWNNGVTQALICQIAAAGVSLNLQHGGTQIIVVEEDWSPSIMSQFYARLWRYGQQKHVHVDTLVADLKIEEAVGRISATKEREHGKFNEIGREMNDE